MRLDFGNATEQTKLGNFCFCEEQGFTIVKFGVTCM